MSESENDTDPLDELFADEDERPEQVDVGTFDVDTATFHEQLEKIAIASERIATLARDLEALRDTGLTDDDVVDLLYGRNASMNKSTIETVIDTVDALDGRLESGGGRRRDLLLRLVADLGGLGKNDTRDVFDELERLHRKYGSDRDE